MRTVCSQERFILQHFVFIKNIDPCCGLGLNFVPETRPIAPNIVTMDVTLGTFPNGGKIRKLSVGADSIRPQTSDAVRREDDILPYIYVNLPALVTVLSDTNVASLYH